MTHVQRKELINSLENLKYNLQLPIGAYGQELEENILTALNLTNDEICIPATKKEINTIEQLAEMVEIGNWQIEWRIKASEITSLSPSNFFSSRLSELVALLLVDFREFSSIGIDAIEANLSHLALYRAVEASDDVDYDAQPNLYTNVEYTKKWAGSFATLLLQIPVAGGFQGGNFYLKNGKQETKVFNTSRNSQKAFHVTAFYDDSQIFMEPITKGARIDLVFNLRYKGTTSGIARPLSQDHVDPLYRIWQPPSSLKCDNKIEMSSLLSKKDKVLIELLSHWKRTEHSRVELYAIPLDHSYCKNSLSFNSLKGIDRSMAEIIVALLGDFVEVHLATVTKYVGYTKEDWVSSGREYVLRKTGKSPKHFRETDWTEYFAGNWVDLHNRRLTLPPLSITVPEELLGIDENVFDQFSNTHLSQNAFDGYSYDRSAIIMWPRNQTFSTAVSFGLDQALDVVESDPPFSLFETKKVQLQYLLALCKKEPNKSWYASTSECSDLRCDRANPVSLQVASKRALRLINLCLLWNMPECGLELLRLLFSKDKLTDYRCSNCSITLDEKQIFFVGGICENQVADKVGELIVLLDWNSAATKDCLMQVFSSNVIFEFKQIGQLAHLAVYLFLHQSFEAADYIRDQVFRLLTDFYLIELDEARSTDTVVESCINMLILVDGLQTYSEDSRLMKLLLKLRSLSSRKPSLVISWLQKTDETILRSLSPYCDFYIDILTNLESRLIEFDGSTNNFPTSLIKFEEEVALLMTSFVRNQDGVKLNRFTERITSSKNQGARLLLAAVISTKNIWAVPSSPLIEDTLISLSAIRFQQLSRFKFSMFKWEQPDAILKELPNVEAFLHSPKECYTYDSFASEEEAQSFASKYFCHPDVIRGYSAKVSEVIFGSDGRVSVKISKTAEIYESSKKQLDMLVAALSDPCSTLSPAKNEFEKPSELWSTPNTPICQVVEPKSSTTKRRPKKNQNMAPPEKRSKRILIKNQPKEADHEVI